MIRILGACEHTLQTLVGLPPRGHFLLLRLEILPPTEVIAVNCAEIEAVMPTLVENATFASLLGNPARHSRDAQAAGNLGVARTESPSTP